MSLQIKQFPEFSKLTIDYKDALNQVVNQFEPYSDFNFSSLFSWDIDSKTVVSILNNNLVIGLADYVTGEMVYSILGTNQMDSCIDQLLARFDSLELVPEVTINSIVSRASYNITESRDNFDYVYDLSNLVQLPGKKHKVKRNKNNNFIRNYEDNLWMKGISFSNDADKNTILRVCDKWANERNRSDAEFENERKAIERLLNNADSLDITGILVFIYNECVGFAINEIISHEYAICHFQKAILAFKNIDVFLSNIVAKEVSHFGCKFINWEQDLGIEGLRQLKSSYETSKFLKKYTITSKS